MIGYATDETKYLEDTVEKSSLLPVSLLFAHKLTAALTSRREDGSLSWLRSVLITVSCSFHITLTI